ncbi:hypothetical protein F5146DRAFT_970412 [Armillaria mellea]|nr:hypothetical protein F5146DRAFT_970412 [Armillaria mellea]
MPVIALEVADKVIRVMAHKDVGLAGLNIIRSLSTSRQILIQNNHILPLLDELPIGDLVFGVFPLLRGPDLSSVMHMGALNNVADIMDLLLQAFEGAAFLHANGIAHRDLFLTNFVTEWYPERTRAMMFTRPRVYIIDFESAIRFSEDGMERITSTFPVPVRSWYRRPLAPELEIPDAPYCPFRLDVWQISNDILRFKLNFPSVQEVILGMHVDDPAKRLPIQEALDMMAQGVKSVPERELMEMRMLDNEDEFVYYTEYE